MLRYLRGKDFLDLVYDGIQWVMPGRFGKVLAAAVTLSMMVGLMYVVNYPVITRWFQGTHP
jgi:hypothetical protein